MVIKAVTGLRVIIIPPKRRSVIVLCTEYKKFLGRYPGTRGDQRQKKIKVKEKIQAPPRFGQRCQDPTRSTLAHSGTGAVGHVSAFSHRASPGLGLAGLGSLEGSRAVLPPRVGDKLRVEIGLLSCVWNLADQPMSEPRTAATSPLPTQRSSTARARPACVNPRSPSVVASSRSRLPTIACRIIPCFPI